MDEINQIVPELIRTGKVVRPRLGVQLAVDQMARQLGVAQGALILNVVPKSPAALAGLMGTRRDTAGHIILGDVIVSIDNKPIANVRDVYSALEHYKAGDTINLVTLRGDQRQTVKVTLQAVE